MNMKASLILKIVFLLMFLSVISCRKEKLTEEEAALLQTPSEENETPDENLSHLSLAEQIKYKKLEQEKPQADQDQSDEGAQTGAQGTVVATGGGVTSAAAAASAKNEFTNIRGEVVTQRRIGNVRNKRKDDEFSFKRDWKRRIPSDYRIGSLADLRASLNQDKKIIDNLTQFFNALAEKKVLVEMLYPEASALIENNLNYYIDSGALPDSFFRIGKINSGGDGVVRVNVRFYYGDAGTDGEVILEEEVSGGIQKWLISDIQVDFMKLLTPYEGFDEPFLPSSYDYFDWE